MKLRTKILLVFGLSLCLTIPGIYWGVTTVLDRVSSGLMQKQAENSALFLRHTLSLGALGQPGFSPQWTSDLLNLTKHVSDESKSYDVSKILLVGDDLKVLSSFPQNETGMDYSQHADIRQAFMDKKMVTVLETHVDPQGVKSSDIDVVIWFEYAPGVPVVLEMKLDFAKSTALLELQYGEIETRAILLAVVLLGGILSLLLLLITRTAIHPVLNLTKAMEGVGAGNLDIQLREKGRDEFSILSKRFNEMVLGIREKTKLTSYVSRSTAEAVHHAVREKGEHPAVRKTLSLFFSDIRGFTTYSESRDPAEVIGTLNKVLGLQAEIIQRYSGDIDKFVGDEVMAVFSTPLGAVEAALEIQKAMKEDGENLDALALGIGIHVGEVMQGDVGSREMKDYTVIGDTVNTAARLQSMAGKGEILISETVLKQINQSGGWTGIPQGELTLKGKMQSVKTYLLKVRG